MANVILFHHVQGLTPGVIDFAEQLRGAGHEVTTPDLFEGATFSSIPEGFGFAQELGSAVDDRARAAAEAQPDQIVYAGFSLGAMLAHEYAQTRPGAQGALLYHHGDVPLDTFGPTWPQGVDIQIHISEEDEFYEEPVVSEFVAAVTETANAELFLYPGSTHLFADSSLNGYDEQAASKLLARTLEFLDRID